MARVIVNVNPQTLGHSGNNAWLQPKTTHSLYRSAPQRKSIRGLVVAAGIFGGLFGNSKGVKACKKCEGKGAIACPGCKGSGRNRKNGNVFERWKCYDCQGFGQITCPKCGGGLGLTPEQRRER